MKLAEALQERADLNTKMDQLRSRIENSALVQEGEQPPENPQALLNELENAAIRLEKLIADINLTNCATLVDGVSLTALIARKDVLKVRINALREIVDIASQGARRARNTEIKILPTVEVAALQKKVDDLSGALRRTDNLIQQTNWSTELMER